MYLSNRTKKFIERVCVCMCVPSISDAVLLRCTTKEFKHWDRYAEYLRFFLTRVTLRTSLSMYSTSLDRDRDTCSQCHYWLILKVTINCLNINIPFWFRGVYRNIKFISNQYNSVVIVINLKNLRGCVRQGQRWEQTQTKPESGNILIPLRIPVSKSSITLYSQIQSGAKRLRTDTDIHYCHKHTHTTCITADTCRGHN